MQSLNATKTMAQSLIEKSRSKDKCSSPPCTGTMTIDRKFKRHFGISFPPRRRSRSSDQSCPSPESPRQHIPSSSEGANANASPKFNTLTPRRTAKSGKDSGSKNKDSAAVKDSNGESEKSSPLFQRFQDRSVQYRSLQHRLNEYPDTVDTGSHQDNESQNLAASPVTERHKVPAAGLGQQDYVMLQSRLSLMACEGIPECQRSASSSSSSSSCCSSPHLPRQWSTGSWQRHHPPVRDRENFR